MPIYEYQCQKCKKKFEIIQSHQEALKTKCIYCHGPVKKVFHPVGIIFKGSGFYTTDYKRSEKKTNEASTPKNLKAQEGKELKKEASLNQ